MSPVRPGTLPWLLRHDLRVGWRDFRAGFGRLGSRSLLGLGAVLAAVLHAALWDGAGEVGALAADAATRGEAEALALPAAGFALLLMLAQALNGSARLLYGRGDLDLLLSSPASPRRVLGARALAVALGAMSSAAIFALPVADDALLQGHAGLLGLYPALAGGALLAAGLGLGATMGLFRLLGPRRTRLAAQVLATLVGAGFMLLFQLRRLLPGLVPADLLGEGSAVRAALLLPVRAGLGEPAALLAWLLLSGGCFGLAASLLGPAFARGAAAAGDADAPASPGRIRRRASRRDFAAGPMPALRRKEWRLLARDPWVLSQMLLQVLYMVPLAALLWTGSRDPALALAPAAVVIVFQAASSLTWLGLSGEDAPDLLAGAPVPAALVRRAKLQAVGAPAAMLAAPPLLYLAAVAPFAALTTAALGALALAAAVALQLWHGAPGRRSRFAGRHRESKLMGLVETALSLLFGVAAALAALPSAWALAPLAVVGAVTLWLRPRARARVPIEAPHA